VYRERALTALEAARAAWTSAYISPSHAGCAAAVRAGLGYAVMPRGLIPAGLMILTEWPALKSADLCVLEQTRPTPAAAALSRFIETRMAARAAF
jgi:DNA-binding transcriptional LysR family regulator